jgi:hypothetical protein
MKIQIDIRHETGTTLLNCSSFDEAIIKLMDEREWHNFWLKNKLKQKINKVKRNNYFSEWDKKFIRKPTIVKFNKLDGTIVKYPAFKIIRRSKK